MYSNFQQVFQTIENILILRIIFILKQILLTGKDFGEDIDEMDVQHNIYNIFVCIDI